MNKDEKIRQRLLTLDTAALCDASPLVRSLGVGLISTHPTKKMVGQAHVVSCFNDYLAVIKAMTEVQSGNVLVIDCRGQTYAAFGELLTAEAIRLNLSGVVVDGAVRDLAGMKQLDLPVFYRYTNPRAGRAEVIEHSSEHVSICGITVFRGDWVVGDYDGVVIIPKGNIEMIVAVAEEIEHIENKVFDSVLKGESLMKIMKFEEFRLAHEKEIRDKLDFHPSHKK